MSTDRETSQAKSDPASSLPGDSIKDTHRGHPDGDVVDNTQAANPSRDPSKVYHTGTNLSGMGRAPHLLGIQRRN